ncbi:MAG: Ig-like domain-containing protein [Eubacteriales bacterium]
MLPKNKKTILTALVLATLSLTAFATDAELLYDAQYCFTAGDFADQGEATLTGIFVTDVPTSAIATIQYGNRTLHPGDVIPADQLSSLVLTPTNQVDAVATLSYLPITENGVASGCVWETSIFSGKNHTPIAEDVTMETYKNIANDGIFAVSDEDGDKLIYQILTAPKRGEVEIHEDGTFTYTPGKNKVGEDSFTYTATDEAGDVSNTATVTIDIRKPMDSATYADMTDDPDQFVALWMQDSRLFSGETVAGYTCFGPDKLVTRGEFVVMLAELTNLSPQSVQLTSGFADEEATPDWMQPFVVSALRAGVISGTTSDEGLVFQPTANLTGAEAAVMIQNALQLPASELAVSDFGDSETVPVWAEDAVVTLYDANFPISVSDCLEPVTRRDVAKLLYAASQHVPDQPNIIAALF